MKNTAKAIRILTLAPILAGIMLICIQAARPEVFSNGSYFAYTFFLLTVLPVFAYPMQKLLPHFREKGREGQRHLAMIFAFLGYVLDCTINIVTGAPDTLVYIGLMYLLSGTLVLAFNQALHLRASGHAAGVAAALLILVTLQIKYALPVGLFIIALVYAASLYMKRHTLMQLLGGTLIPIGVNIVLSAFFI